jgi:hypothetical protein
VKRLILLSIVALLSIAIVLGIGFFALDATGYEPTRRLWILRQRIFGIEKVGIWQDDPKLGWRHLPDSVGRHRNLPDFDVRYRIDAHGHRATPAPYTLPKVLVLGGSFTFGHGVEDAASYSALLEAKLPGYKVINGAVNAWGTSQVVLKLEESLARYNDIRLVVYGFIEHHRFRNHLRKDWMQHLSESRDRRLPYFILDGDGLAFRGLADSKTHGMPASPELDRTEDAMNNALLRALVRQTEEHSIPLLVVHLPDGSPREQGEWVERAVGAEHFLDLRRHDPFQHHRFEHDNHPTAGGHRLVADHLIPQLTDMLADPRDASTE